MKPRFVLSSRLDNDLHVHGYVLKKSNRVIDGSIFYPRISVRYTHNGEEIDGHTLIARALEFNALLGQHHAEAIIRNPEMIPENWKSFYFPFPGTIWVSVTDELFIPCMYYGGEKWFLDFDSITSQYCNGGRLLI